jgi:fibronectin type 3 domain-containing protein
MKYLLPLLLALNLQAAWLEWGRNSETNIGGYRVYYGTNSRSYETNIDVGNFTEWRLAGLSNGITHYFAVTAYDTDGLESDFSNEVSYRTKPNAPRNLRVVKDSTNVTVQASSDLNTWAAVATEPATNKARFYRLSE